MSRVIQVLAQMASDATFQSRTTIEALLTTAGINTEQSESIIAKDITSLGRQLDICPDIVCLVALAEDEDDEAQENIVENKIAINF